MFKSLFNPENGLMVTMAQVTDVIFLSLFWLLGCFPILTIGPAAAALYDACARGLRTGDKHTWHRFLTSFRGSLKVGIPATAVYLALVIAGGWGMIQVWNGAVYGQISWALFAAAALLGMLGLGILSLLFPLLSRFEMGLGLLLKNTFLLGLVNLPRTLLLGMLQGLTVWLCARFILPLFFLPAVSALLSSLLVEPMLRPFLPEEEITQENFENAAD